MKIKLYTDDGTRVPSLQHPVTSLSHYLCFESVQNINSTEVNPNDRDLQAFRIAKWWLTFDTYETKIKQIFYEIKLANVSRIFLKFFCEKYIDYFIFKINYH